MIGENSDLGQDADAEADRDSGLNAENIGQAYTTVHSVSFPSATIVYRTGCSMRS